MRLAVLLLLALSGCSVAWGGRPEACGEYPGGAGPAAIVTRDQELCEVVRLRVLFRLDRTPGMTRGKLDHLIELTSSWEGYSTLDRAIAAIRKDGGDVMADEVQRAVGEVLERSTRPMSESCSDVQRCLVKGVAKGVRIALIYAEPMPDTPATKPEERRPGD